MYKKFQIICGDNLEEVLKLSTVILCVRSVSGVKVAPKIVSCQFYLF